MTGILPRLPADAPTGTSTPLAKRQRLIAPTSSSGPQPPSGPLPLAVAPIDSPETFQAISTPAGDLVANGRVAKFLIDRRDPGALSVRFVNGNFTENGKVPEAARFHYFFGRAAFDIPESLD
ncbi:MAG: hypothetical protein ABIW17_10325, partial [Marmoricola sp.]